MSDYTTRYFQLTSDILIEYNYATENGIDCKIDISGLSDSIVVKTTKPSIKFFLFDDNSSGINLYSSNFVIPTNNSMSSFIKPEHYSGVHTEFSVPDDMKTTITSGLSFESDGNSHSMDFDKIRFHFTNGRYMADYDGLIFQTYVYDTSKNKICFMSFKLSKTDNLMINDNPMIFNQKRYNTYIEVKIPSVYRLLKSYSTGYNGSGDTLAFKSLRKWLMINKNEGDNTPLMTNTPLNISLYGVKHERVQYGYTYYIVEHMSDISIPSIDTYGDLYVDVHEANDGDYFELQVKVEDGTTFSDYISNMDENPNIYIITHEIKLIEHYVTNANIIKSEVTHTEQIIVNSTQSYLDEHDREQVVVNEQILDEPMKYRPIIKYGSRCFKFTIEDTVRITNSNDNTTIIKKGTLNYDNPIRYGKKMNQINLTSIPPVVNVYNRRTDGEIDTDNNTIRITNGGSSNGPKIETNNINIASFIESANIVVTIGQVSASDIETLA